MERRDFFRKLGIGVAAVVAAPMIMANTIETKPMKPIMTRYAHKKINESFYKTIRIDHKGWRVPTKEGWTHLIVNYDGKVYVQGEWNRSLSADEVTEFYNHNKALPNQSICIWTKDYNEGNFHLKLV